MFNLLTTRQNTFYKNHRQVSFWWQQSERVSVVNGDWWLYLSGPADSRLMSLYGLCQQHCGYYVSLY